MTCSMVGVSMVPVILAMIMIWGGGVIQPYWEKGGCNIAYLSSLWVVAVVGKQALQYLNSRLYFGVWLRSERWFNVWWDAY